MKKSTVKQQLIPTQPGVYFFLSKKKEILYIGKATSLRHRVMSYFDKNIREKRSALIEKMINEASTIEFTITDSILEALLLETNLIRTHKPKYNSRSKDDKSYNHILITKEAFPRVLIMRGKDITDEVKLSSSAIYGPFPSSAMLKDALKIIRRIFKFYDGDITSDAHESAQNKKTINFNRQIGLYPSSDNARAYKQVIKNIKYFFEGKKERVIDNLRRQMQMCARKMKFEEANYIKKQIYALEHIQDVSLIKNDVRDYSDERNIRIEAYDVAHMGGTDMVGVMAVLIGNTPDSSLYRKFIIRHQQGPDDTRALQEVFSRRLKHPEWGIPHIIVVDGGKQQIHTVEKILKAQNMVIPVVGVVKDEHHKPKVILGSKSLIFDFKKEILYANAESHRFAITFHKKRRTEGMLSSTR